MAHLAAVAHYTNLARQAAALQSAQVAYDNRAEPEQDDTPTLDEQTDAAIEVIGRACRARTPGAIADLLRNAADMLNAIADEVGQ